MSGVKGKSGGKTLPRETKERSGTFRADRHNTDEPTLPVYKKAPRCPDHLEGEARTAWIKVSKVLTEMGVLTSADLHALEAYCNIYARWRTAEKELTKSLTVWGGKDGDTLVASPYVRIAKESQMLMRAWMNEFGITPSSRSRVRVNKKPEKTDKERWFGITKDSRN